MRPTYLALSILLGGLIGFLLTLIIVTLSLHDGSESGPLLAWWFYALIVVCALGGFFIGRVWWRWIYVERRWGH